MFTFHQPRYLLEVSIGGHTLVQAARDLQHLMNCGTACLAAG